MRGTATLLILVVALLWAVACAPFASDGRSEDPVNKRSIDELSIEMYKLVDAVASEFGGMIELINDDRVVCNSDAMAPGCPDGGVHTHMMQYYGVRVSPLPEDFDAIVTERVLPRFPSDRGWSAKKSDLGNSIHFNISNRDGSAITVLRGVGESATMGVNGRTRMVAVRPGDLDAAGQPLFTATHTPSLSPKS